MRRGQRGFVLLLSVILLVSISVITAAFISLAIIRTRSVAAGMSGAKAFWLAEAGLQQAINRIKTDSIYRDAPADLTGSLGDGTYAVSVVKQPSQMVYSVVSTGTVGGVSKDVSQTVAFSVSGWLEPFTDYGVFSWGGSVLLQNSANKITGDVYTTWFVTTQGFSTVTGTVYANMGFGNYVRLPLPVPRVTIPALDTTYYTALINTAGTYHRRDMTYGTLNLAGGTVYVNGRVNVANIIGPGIIVCTGNFTLNGNIGQDVTVISNASISMTNNSHVHSGAVLYASTGIFLTGNSVVLDNAVLLTPGAVALNANNIVVNGVIFCGGNLALQKTVVVNGAVACGGSITMSGSAQIVQNKNQLPFPVPEGLPRGTSTASVIISNWQGG